MKRHLFFCLWLVGVFSFGHSLAQESALNPVWKVFITRNLDAQGLTRLDFIQTFDGTQTSTEVYGERFTPLHDRLLYFDLQNRRVMTLRPRGEPQIHPFIFLPEDAQRIDWLVSADGLRIVWTVTRTSPAGLFTRTEIANLDGSERQVVLEDGPRAGIRALPVALSPDNATLYMDAQPDGLAEFSAYPQYAGLFSVSVWTGEIATLPGEPSCFCGAGIRADSFIRLTLNANLSGFDVRLYDLSRNQSAILPAFSRTNYTQAGDILIAPDGSQAVYALSRIENFGALNQSLETIFVRIDLQTRTQSPLSEPITTYVHPVAWTEDNSAILLTSPQENGTWKLNLSDGSLQRIASAAYLATLHP